MKIFCVGKNYADHAKEMNSEVPKEPLIFAKPATALLLENKPFYYPEFTKNLHHEVEILLKISKNGKHIAPEFAASYYDEIGLGIDFTARDLQDQCKKAGQPWEIAKAFDNSAVVGNWVDKSSLNLENIDFHLKKNNEIVQKGNTSDLIYNFETIICYLSKFFTLQKGDIIFTGTPAGVSAVNIGDILTGYIGETQFFTCEIK